MDSTDPDARARRPQAESASLARQVLAARAGDRAAFRELFEQFAPLVHAVALGIVDQHEAEDVTQDVFLTAWRRLGELRQPQTCGAWLATMARNRARRVAGRTTSTRVQTGVEPAQLETRDRSDSRPDPHLETTRLLAHLRALPEAYREALTLRLVEQRSGPEIAALLGRPEGSVRVNLFRGMKLLRARLRPELEQA